MQFVLSTSILTEMTTPPACQSMRMTGNSVEDTIRGPAVSEQHLRISGDHLHCPEWRVCHPPASHAAGLRVRGLMCECLHGTTSK